VGAGEGLVTVRDDATIILSGDAVRPGLHYRRAVTLGSPRRSTAQRLAPLLDALLVVVLLVPLAGHVFERARTGRPGIGSPGTPASVWIGGALAVVAIVPLLWRRRAPLATWIVSGSATVAGLAIPGLGTTTAPIAALIATYTVASRSPRDVSVVVGAVTLVGATVATAVGQAPQHGWGVLLLPVALVSAAWLVGDNLRVRRDYLAELEAKARRTEADRAEESARAASRERARIARELHDVIAHHVSVIAIQAGAARMLADGANPTAARVALERVEVTARQALAELRQLLGVLRHDGDPPALAPQPGLERLDDLLAEVRGAGLPVTLQIHGSALALPPPVDLSAYRIVQEALTNVLKHQGRVPTTVALSYSPKVLDITVEDHGPNARLAAVAIRPGHGLVGMRERVGLFGGRLEAGPAADGGFVVHARIPLEGISA
jgi:signal transduction histidine kinase